MRIKIVTTSDISEVFLHKNGRGKYNFENSHEEFETVALALEYIKREKQKIGRMVIDIYTYDK